MRQFLFKDRDGQTPLPTELQKGLKLKLIQTVGELDEHEELNIAEGLIWLEKQQNNGSSHDFWLKLHKRLFGDVWSWAGEIRTYDINNPDFLTFPQIWPAIKQLEGDLAYWMESNILSHEEITARFHERIETIHPFANGNGQFGRIITNHISKQRKCKIPTWGIAFLNDPEKRRKKYISALDEARRNGNYKELMKFIFT